MAKLYHQPPPPARAEKLHAMVAAASPELLRFAAWPQNLLLDAERRLVRGILMPRVAGHQEIHDLYSPGHRRLHFPGADWAFLLTAARNIALAFAVIHEAGHVIGDVNQGNVVVAGNAMVRLIDCDSFQLRQNGRVFPCEVGVREFTPPELQGRSFTGVVRTANHDSFGLAVLLFHLLFMGRHPFAGRFLGTGHMPIEKAISEGRFAFGAAAARRQMQQPPHALPLAASSASVALLFERAFAPESAQGGRPTAREWLASLDRLRTELRACARTSAHKYHGSLPACPWCEIERAGGPDFFLSAAMGVRRASTFDLDKVWADVSAVSVPWWGKPPEAPASAARAALPIPSKRRLIGSIAGWAAVAAAIVALLGPGGTWLAVLVLGAAWLALKGGEDLRKAVVRRSEYGQAVRELEAAQRQWEHLAQEAGRTFANRRTELEHLRNRFAEIEREKQGAIAHLHARRRQLQLQHHLEKHFLSSARIRGIGPGRRATLASYGIATAADVTSRVLWQVPGIGERIGGELLAWRQRVESAFQYDPSKSLDPADVRQVEHEFARKREAAEREMLTGLEELRTIAKQSEKRQQEMREAFRRLARRVDETAARRS